MYRFTLRAFAVLALLALVLSVGAEVATQKPGLGVALAKADVKVQPGVVTRVDVPVRLGPIEGAVQYRLRPQGALQVAGNLERQLEVTGSDKATMPLDLLAPEAGVYHLTVHFTAPEQSGLNHRSVVLVVNAGDVPQKAQSESTGRHTTLRAQERVERQ